MTTIIFRAIENDVEIAFDSQTTQNIGSHRDIKPKVFVNNDIVYAVAGPSALKGLLAHADLPYYESGSCERFVQNVLLPAIRRAVKPLELNEDQHYEILVVVDGRIFEIQDGVEAIQRTDRRHAIGSGWQFAHGALSVGADAWAAANAAAVHDIYTSGIQQTTARTLLGTLPAVGPLLVEAPLEVVAA